MEKAWRRPGGTYKSIWNGQEIPQNPALNQSKDEKPKDDKPKDNKPKNDKLKVPDPNKIEKTKCKDNTDFSVANLLEIMSDFAEGLAKHELDGICGTGDGASGRTLKKGTNFGYLKKPMCNRHNCHGFGDDYFNAFIDAKEGCEFKISLEYCRMMFDKTLKDCDVKGLKHGGEVTDNCATFMFYRGKKP